MSLNKFEENKKEVVNLKDVLKSDWNALPILNLLGKTVAITGYELIESKSKRGVCILKLEDGERYYTFSKVVSDQLALLDPIFGSGKSVRATINKIKNYYSLS